MLAGPCCDEARDRFRLKSGNEISLGFSTGLNRWVIQYGREAIAIDYCPWCGVCLRAMTVRPSSADDAAGTVEG